MKIKFPVNLFANSAKVKVSVIFPETLMECVNRLSEVLGMNQSETIRWAVEQVIKEAIDQGKIILPETTPTKDKAV